MRILITTGIFEPEAGGPAVYAPNLARMLKVAGADITVVTYSDKANYDFDSEYPFRLVRVVRGKSKLRNYLNFLRVVWGEMKHAELVYSLDWIAAGLPVVVAAFFRRRPVVIRVGGDYMWEQKYLESGAEPMPLADFYERGLERRFALLFHIIRFVLHRADHVVFNTDAQRALYKRRYGLGEVRTSVIYNPSPRKDHFNFKRETANHELVFAGRFIVMKNVTSLIRAFTKARLPDSYTLLLIGNGPQESEIRRLTVELGMHKRISIMHALRQQEMYARIKDCRAIILPSWTDISPNQVYEALSFDIPVLVSKENYLSVRGQLPEMLDPRSVDDITAKLEMLADEKRYQEFATRCRAIHFTHSWDDVLKEHQSVFKKVLDSQSE